MTAGATEAIAVIPIHESARLGVNGSWEAVSKRSLLSGSQQSLPSSAEKVMTTLDWKKLNPFSSIALITALELVCCSSSPLGVTSRAKKGAPV